MHNFLPHYYPYPPNNITDDDWEKWFDQPGTYEFPNQTRKHYDMEVVGGDPTVIRWYLDVRGQELENQIERLVNFRALPQLKKEINGRSKMVVGVVPMQVWEWWLDQHTSQNQPKTRYKNFKLPVHNGQYKSFFKHYVSWTKGNLPRLRNKCWWFSKWCNLDGVLFRSEVQNLTLVKNSWTGVVTVEFSYNLWKYDYTMAKWERQ